MNPSFIANSISVNPERLLDDAKQLSPAPGYAPGAPRTDITVSGEGFALTKMGVWMTRQGGFISEYDAVIGRSRLTC